VEVKSLLVGESADPELAMAARQAQQKALAEASTQRAEAPLQLAADEVVTVQSSQLSLGVPVSGSLRAVDSAMVKARVAGELQGLTLREGDTVKVVDASQQKSTPAHTESAPAASK